jgi:hypothetical protein
MTPYVRTLIFDTVPPSEYGLGFTYEVPLIGTVLRVYQDLIPAS